MQCFFLLYCACHTYLTSPNAVDCILNILKLNQRLSHSGHHRNIAEKKNKRLG